VESSDKKETELRARKLIEVSYFCGLCLGFKSKKLCFKLTLFPAYTVSYSVVCFIFYYNIIRKQIQYIHGF
jgi:hypothetical protein